MSVAKVTQTTIERGVRVVSTADNDMTVKKQLTAFLGYSLDEKKELDQLNSKLSSFIKRVRHLEAENSHLLGAINNMHATWGEDTRKVREQYDQNLLEMRGCIDEVAHLKTIADVRNKRAAYESGEFKYQLEEGTRLEEKQNNKIKGLERELLQLNDSYNFLKQAVDQEMKDIERHKGNRDDTWASLIELLDRLDDELFKRITTEYGNQTLREQIEFLRQINERELAEMEQLGQILPFNEQIEFYKDQLKRVISNIRKDYEQLHVEATREMEEWMTMKKVELENMYNEKDPSAELEMNICMENIGNLRQQFEDNTKEIDALRKYHDMMAKRLQDVEESVDLERAHINDTLESQEEEVRRLNAELEALTNDCNHINVNKATLEYEINVYKRLLDSQLDRYGKKVVENVVIVPEKKPEVLVTNESFGGHVKNKKEKKGPIGISDAASDGTFIQVENDSVSDVVDLSGWILKRQVDKNAELVYNFPNKTILEAGKSIKVWGKSYTQYLDSNDLSASFENWGIGIDSKTYLIDDKSIEKSFFDQHITFGY